MKNLKHSRIVVNLFILSLVLVGSCQKDDPTPDPDPTTTYSVTGLWQGVSSSGGNSAPFNLSVKTDGTCTCEGISPGTQENLGYGTWSLVESKFTFNIKWVYGYSTNINLQVTNTATFNTSNGTITGGVYHAVSPSGATNDGTFSLTKVN